MVVWGKRKDNGQSYPKDAKKKNGMKTLPNLSAQSSTIEKKINENAKTLPDLSQRKGLPNMRGLPMNVAGIPVERQAEAMGMSVEDYKKLLKEQKETSQKLTMQIAEDKIMVEKLERAWKQAGLQYMKNDFYTKPAYALKVGESEWSRKSGAEERQLAHNKYFARKMFLREQEANGVDVSELSKKQIENGINKWLPMVEKLPKDDPRVQFSDGKIDDGFGNKLTEKELAEKQHLRDKRKELQKEFGERYFPYRKTETGANYRGQPSLKAFMKNYDESQQQGIIDEQTEKLRAVEYNIKIAREKLANPSQYDEQVLENLKQNLAIKEKEKESITNRIGYAQEKIEKIREMNPARADVIEESRAVEAVIKSEWWKKASDDEKIRIMKAVGVEPKKLGQMEVASFSPEDIIQLGEFLEDRKLAKKSLELSARTGGEEEFKRDDEGIYPVVKPEARKEQMMPVRYQFGMTDRYPLDMAIKEQSVLLVRNLAGDYNYNNLSEENKEKEWNKILKDPETYQVFRNEAISRNTNVKDLVKELSGLKMDSDTDRIQEKIDTNVSVIKNLERYGDKKKIGEIQKEIEVLVKEKQENELTKDRNLYIEGTKSSFIPQFARDMLFARDQEVIDKTPVTQRALATQRMINGEVVTLGGEEFKSKLGSIKSPMRATVRNQRATEQAKQDAMVEVRDKAFNNDYLRNETDYEEVSVLKDYLNNPDTSKYELKTVIEKIKELGIPLPDYEDIRLVIDKKQSKKLGYNVIEKTYIKSSPTMSDVGRGKADKLIEEAKFALDLKSKNLKNQLLKMQKAGNVFKEGWNEKKYTREIVSSVKAVKPVESLEPLGKGVGLNPPTTFDVDENGRRRSMIRGATRQFTNQKQLIGFLNYIDNKMRNTSLETQEDRDYRERAIKDGIIETENVAMPALTNPDGSVVRGTGLRSKTVPKKNQILNWNDYMYATKGGASRFVIGLSKADGGVEMMGDPNEIMNRLGGMSKNKRYNYRRRLDKARDQSMRNDRENIEKLVASGRFILKGGQTVDKIVNELNKKSRFGLD